MKKIKLFLLSLIVFSFLGCEKEELKVNENNTTQLIPSELNTTAKKSNRNAKRDPNRPSATLKCKIECINGGFSVNVYEFPNGGIKYTYIPKVTIYVNHAYHTSPWAKSTANYYKYAGYAGINTLQAPNPQFKDVNGNIIIGSVYIYQIKQHRTPCFQQFTTNMLYLGSSLDPCDDNIAFNRLNISQNKPTGCFVGMYGSQIFCPNNPIITFPGIEPPAPPKFQPVVYTNYRLDCTGPEDGLCVINTGNLTHNSPIDPLVGPVIFEDLLEETGQDALKLTLTRNFDSPQLEISNTKQLAIPQYVINALGLPEGSEFEYGNYNIFDEESGFDYVNIPLKQE